MMPIMAGERRCSPAAVILGRRSLTMKVLVVEDSAPVRERIVRLLAGDARLTIVGTAATNAEAMARFAASHPELVTLDVSLPDGVTLDTMVRMLASPTPPAVIVITGHVEPGYRERYIRAGATHFMSKLDLDQLPALVRSVLESR
jgi:DNA-binding NarL/FixJ family response regulator